MKSTPPAASPLSDQDFGRQDPALGVHLSCEVPDPDLARVIIAWPDLPDHIRAAVLALVGVAPHP
jgi:hypothetical protein